MSTFRNTTDKANNIAEKIEDSRWKYKEGPGPRGPGRWQIPIFNEDKPLENDPNLVGKKYFHLAEEDIKGGKSEWEKHQVVVEQNRERKRRRKIAGLPPDENEHIPGKTWEVVYQGKTYVGSIVQQDVQTGVLKARTYDGIVERPPTPLITQENLMKLQGHARRKAEEKIRMLSKIERARRRKLLTEETRMIQMTINKEDDKLSGSSSDGSNISDRPGEGFYAREKRLLKHQAGRVAARRRRRRLKRPDGKGDKDERNFLLKECLHGVDGYKHGKRRKNKIEKDGHTKRILGPKTKLAVSDSVKVSKSAEGVGANGEFSSEESDTLPSQKLLQEQRKEASRVRKNNPTPGIWKPRREKINTFKYANRRNRCKGQLDVSKDTINLLRDPPPARYYGPNATDGHNWSEKQQSLLTHGVKIIESVSKGRPPAPTTTPPRNSPAGILLCSKEQESKTYKKIGPTGTEVWDWGFKTNDDVIKDGKLVTYYASELGRRDAEEAEKLRNSLSRFRKGHLEPHRSKNVPYSPVSPIRNNKSTFTEPHTMKIYRNTPEHQHRISLIQCFRTKNPDKYYVMVGKSLTKGFINGIIHAIAFDERKDAIVCVKCCHNPTPEKLPTYILQNSTDVEGYAFGSSVFINVNAMGKKAEYSVYAKDFRNQVLVLKLKSESHLQNKHKELKDNSIVSPIRVNRGSKKSLPKGQVTPLDRHWDVEGATKVVDKFSECSYSSISSSDSTDSDESGVSDTSYKQNRNNMNSVSFKETETGKDELNEDHLIPWMERARAQWVKDDMEILALEESEINRNATGFKADLDMPGPLPLPPGSPMLGSRTAWLPEKMCPLAIDNVWGGEEEWKAEKLRLMRDKDFVFLRNISHQTFKILLTLHRCRLFGGRSLRDLLPISKAVKIISVDRKTHVTSQNSIPDDEAVAFVVIRGSVYVERSGTIMYTLRSGAHFGMADALALSQGNENRNNAKQRLLNKRRRQELIGMEAKAAKKMRALEKKYNKGHGRAAAERYSLIKSHTETIHEALHKQIPKMEKQIEQALYLAGGSLQAAERHRKNTQNEIDRQKEIIATCRREIEEAELALVAAKPEQSREEDRVKAAQKSVQSMRDEMKNLFHLEKEAQARDRRLGVSSLQVCADLGRRSSSFIAGASPAEEAEEALLREQRIAAKLMKDHPTAGLSSRAAKAAGIGGANRFGLSRKKKQNIEDLSKEEKEAKAKEEAMQSIADARARNAMKKAMAFGRHIECIAFPRGVFDKFIATDPKYRAIIDRSNRIREQRVDHEIWKLLATIENNLPSLDDSRISGKERQDLLDDCLENATRAHKLCLKVMRPEQYCHHYGYSRVVDSDGHLDENEMMLADPILRKKQMAAICWAALGDAFRVRQQKNSCLRASRKALAAATEAQSLGKSSHMIKFDQNGDPVSSGDGDSILEVRMRSHLGEAYRRFGAYRASYNQYQKCLEMSREACDLEGEISSIEKLMDICAKMGSRFESAEFCKLLIGLYPRLNAQRKAQGKTEIEGSDITNRKGWKGQKWLQDVYSNDTREKLLQERENATIQKFAALGNEYRKGKNRYPLNAGVGHWPPRGLCLGCRRPLHSSSTNIVPRYCPLCGADNQELGRMSKEEVMLLWRGNGSLSKKMKISGSEKQSSLARKSATTFMNRRKDTFNDLPASIKSLSNVNVSAPRLISNIPEHERFQHVRFHHLFSNVFFIRNFVPNDF